MSCRSKLIYDGAALPCLSDSIVVYHDTVSIAPDAPKLPKIATEIEIRKAVFDTAVYYAGFVRERGGNNKHWAISRFNRILQIPLNSPYCSSFGIYCWRANGIRIPATDGTAYSWRKKSRLVWHRGLLHIDDMLWPRIKIFDAVVYTWSHVAFVAPDTPNVSAVSYSKRGITVIGANTAGGVKRAEGVYYPVRRSMNYVYGIYDHFTPVYAADSIGVSERFLKVSI